MRIIKAPPSELEIKCWCENPESGALDQARNLAQLPFAVEHIALMPDTHQGYGMPIGGVLATRGFVIPNAVGVDIGCGMICTKTNIPVDQVSKEQLQEVYDGIVATIPVGFNHRTKPCNMGFMPARSLGADYPVIAAEYDSARYQMGTLGGGR